MTKHSIDWDKHYFILYKVNPDRTITSVSKPKPIILCDNKNGQKFYGVRAGKYGMYVPADSQRWGIFSFKDNIWKAHFSELVPESYQRQVITLGDGRIAYCRRGKANLNFSITINKNKETS